MTETGSADSILPYAAPCRPRRQSRYALASLVVSAIAIASLALSIAELPLPFDEYKRHRIGTVAALLALILAIAAYRRPGRKRSMTHMAAAAAGLTFATYVLIVPL